MNKQSLTYAKHLDAMNSDKYGVNTKLYENQWLSNNKHIKKSNYVYIYDESKEIIYKENEQGYLEEFVKLPDKHTFRYILYLRDYGIDCDVKYTREQMYDFIDDFFTFSNEHIRQQVLNNFEFCDLYNYIVIFGYKFKYDCVLDCFEHVKLKNSSDMRCVAPNMNKYRTLERKFMIDETIMDLIHEFCKIGNNEYLMKNTLDVYKWNNSYMVYKHTIKKVSNTRPLPKCIPIQAVKELAYCSLIIGERKTTDKKITFYNMVKIASIENMVCALKYLNWHEPFADELLLSSIQSSIEYNNFETFMFCSQLLSEQKHTHEPKYGFMKALFTPSIDERIKELKRFVFDIIFAQTNSKLFSNVPFTETILDYYENIDTYYIGKANYDANKVFPFILSKYIRHRNTRDYPKWMDNLMYDIVMNKIHYLEIRHVKHFVLYLLHGRNPNKQEMWDKFLVCLFLGKSVDDYNVICKVNMYASDDDVFKHYLAKSGYKGKLMDKNGRIIGS